MISIEACIFDLDGVIVDTAKHHYKAWRTIANHLGFDFSVDENEKLKGVSRVDSLNIILDIGNISLTEAEKSKYLIEKNDLYLSYVENMDANDVLPGIEKFIKDLQSKGIKIALGSASKNARKILEQIGYFDYFEAIVDGNEVTKSKPDPEVFVKASKLLGKRPEQSIVFEDSYSGILAANKGGFYSVGLGQKEFLNNAMIVYENLKGKSIDDITKELENEK